MMSVCGADPGGLTARPRSACAPRAISRVGLQRAASMPPHEQLASSSPEFASNITAEIPGKPALALSGTRAPHAPALLSPAARRLAAGLRMAMCGLTACPLLAASNWKRKCQTRYNEFSPLPSFALLSMLTARAGAVRRKAKEGRGENSL